MIHLAKAKHLKAEEKNIQNAGKCGKYNLCFFSYSSANMIQTSIMLLHPLGSSHHPFFQ